LAVYKFECELKWRLPENLLINCALSWHPNTFVGQARGGGFAGASAGYGVGAGAALGGNVDESGANGGLGSEAHARGASKKTVQLSQTPQQQQQVCH